MEPDNPFMPLRRMADTLIVSVMIAAFAMAATAADLPASNAAYSADSRIRVGEIELVGRVYHDRGLERREITIEGVEQVVIRRPDLNHVYVVMPAFGMGVETNLDAVPTLASDAVLEGLQAEAVGHEWVAGLPATKYRLTGTDPAGGLFDGFIWFSEDGIALRVSGTVSAGGRTEAIDMRLDNVRVGPQDPSLFERPDTVTFMPFGPGVGSGGFPRDRLGAAA